MGVTWMSRHPIQINVGLIQSQGAVTDLEHVCCFCCCCCLQTYNDRGFNMEAAFMEAFSSLGPAACKQRVQAALEKYRLLCSLLPVMVIWEGPLGEEAGFERVIIFSHGGQGLATSARQAWTEVAYPLDRGNGMLRGLAGSILWCDPFSQVSARM